MIRSICSKHNLVLALLFLCSSIHASFIEQTLGTAVVKDATAVYFNPAALTVVPTQQLIFLGTVAKSQFQFTGNAQNVPLGINESGRTNTNSNFYLPSMYVSTPINDRFFGGFAVVVNDFNRELDNHSVLRYAQAPNQTDNVDLVPALGIKVNKFLSIGGNLNITHAHLIQEPISGIPRLNIPESHSFNNSKGSSVGGDFGFLMQLGKKTFLGFNYRSAITYYLYGTSKINYPQFTFSNNYHFKYWTPARNVLSLSHFFNDKIGLIGTIQYIQWDIFKDTYVYNFATQLGSQAFIVPKAQINYDFHNSWLLTLGTIYNISSKWTIRFAGTYNQSPSNGKLQISPGDSLVLGSSMGYQIVEHLVVDFSYGHGFFKKESINILGQKNIIIGTNEGSHDTVSLRFTLSA